MKSQYAALYIESKTNGRHLLRFDSDDYKKLINFPGFKGFCIQSTNTKKPGKNPTLYPCIYGKIPNTGRTYVKQVHRVLIDIVPYGHVVDHIDGNTFNNERRNLEVVTRAENTRRAQRKKDKNG